MFRLFYSHKILQEMTEANIRNIEPYKSIVTKIRINGRLPTLLIYCN